MNLDGKTALVSGSGKNIGRATVLELARRGANVIVNTRTNVAEAEDVAKEARKFGVESIFIRYAPFSGDLRNLKMNGGEKNVG